MSAEFETGNVIRDDLLEIAEAIATRSTQFGDIVGRIAASINDVEYVPDSQATRNAKLIGQTTLNILRVESPSIKVGIEDTVEALSSGINFQSFIDQINNGEENEDFHTSLDAFRSVHAEVTTELLQNAGLDSEKMSFEFERSYKAACAVAGEHGVRVAEVYGDDDLYYESCRRAETPEEYVANVAAVIKATSGETIQAGIVRVIDQVLPKSLLAEMSKEELDEMVTEMQLDPGLIEQMEAVVEPTRESIRQAFTYMFIKVYGYDRLTQLKLTSQDDFLPRKPWVKEVFADFTEE